MKVTINKDGETTTVEGSFEEVQIMLLDLGYFDTTSSQAIEDTARYAFDPSPAKPTLDPSIFDPPRQSYHTECKWSPYGQAIHKGVVYTDEGAAIPITYGNGVSFAEAAEKALKEHQNKEDVKKLASLMAKTAIASIAVHRKAYHPY